MNNVTWKKHFTYIPPNSKFQNQSIESNVGSPAVGSKFSSYLPEVYAGQPQRKERYSQYDIMDADAEVNVSLDTIAEFCTQTEEQNTLPFALEFNDDISETETTILNESLRQWVKLNKFSQRIFKIFRNTIKYGDQFFIRDPETNQWLWVDPAKVQSIIVNQAKGKKPEYYIVTDLDPNMQSLAATTPPPAYQQTTGLVARSPGPITQSYPRGDTAMGRFVSGSQMTSFIAGEDMVHISLSDGMDNNWPFGNSILEAIYKVYKQKELLEDSIIIYRVQRAPERRVFYIDVGNMPTHKAMAFVERVKNEIHQRRIPNRTGGGSCFPLNQKIPLLDGRTLALSDLIKEYESGKENWVYSINPDNGEIVPGNISWAGITRKNAKIIKLHLDNGKVIKCTPDHKFPIWGKGFVEAKDITPTDSLFSFNTRYWSINEKKENDYGPQYHQVYDHKTKSWKFTHRIVGNFFKSKSLHNEMTYLNENFKEKNVIHHKDYDKYNNNPSNLYFMNGFDHFQLHANSTADYLASLSEEEKNTLKKKKSVSSKKYWNKRKTNSSEYSYYLANLGERARIRIENNPEYKKKLLQNLTEMKKPWRNQSIKSNDELLEIIVGYAHLAPNNDFSFVQSALSTDGRFMKLYQNLNNPEKGKITKYALTEITPTTLRRILRFHGFITWRKFLNHLGLESKKPSRKLVFTREQLNITVKYLSNKNYKSKDIVEILRNDDEFMAIHNDNNKFVKGNARPNHFSKNTFNCMMTYFGYKNYSAFKENIECFNHKVVAIEESLILEDTGTITVDGNETLHPYHTFALEEGVFTKNSVMDASYNPLSMLEDFFFATTAEGRGSKVETLPGGDQLGQIDDLLYFDNKLRRGLRIPSSYLPGGAEDGNTTYTDGRVGTAYIQEYRFAKFCKRLQELLIPSFDHEFKLYIKKKDINIDTGIFELRFNEPQSFSKYRQIEIDSAQINVFQPLADVGFFSKRFLLKRFLNLKENEILENEKLWKEENPDKTDRTDPGVANESNVDLGDVGVGSGDSLGLDNIDSDSEDTEGANVGSEDTGGEAPAPSANADITL